ncbi:MAG TPA: efflux RND transporter periplasmic adaptor subunit [Rudaea sp.]|nr:efflux RND transporter periplasmic adaptor subunit [Rudaea sp.]
MPNHFSFSVFARAVFAVIFAVVLVACSGKKPPPPEAAVPVDTAKVIKKTVPDLIDAPGSVEPIDTVAVKSLVDGQLLEAHVKDGDEVKKGELLFKIDARPAQATLAQVQAALAKDAAARDLAKAQLDRYEPVATKGFISADQMQQYRTAYAAAAASVKVDQANVEATKLTLGYTDIFAPIDGRAGRILVQAGNLVKANDTQPLLTINRISPIYVNFSIPGLYVDRVRNAQRTGTLPVFASGDGIDGRIDGQMSFIDNAVDPATNTVKLRASFPNADERLWPGEFVNITLTLGTDTNALVVPDAAVKAGPNGTYVFLIKPDSTAEQRNVKVTRSVNGESMISAGVAENDEVVTDGQSRLVNGTKVKTRGTEKTAAK